jgi:hypothetical protein
MQKNYYPKIICYQDLKAQTIDYQGLTFLSGSKNCIVVLN